MSKLFNYILRFLILIANIIYITLSFFYKKDEKNLKYKIYT